MKAAVAAAMVAMLAGPAHAQQAPVEAIPDALPSSASPARPIVLTEDEARTVLATTLPDDAPLDQRLALLKRQRAAARVLGEQAALLHVLDQLSSLGRGEPEWPAWTVDLMNTEYTFGSQQRSIEIGEKLLAEPGLSPAIRTNASANLAWKYCDSKNDIRNCERLYAAAQSAFAELPATTTADARNYSLVVNLHARSEVMRVRGDPDGRVTALRQALVIARGAESRAAVAASGDSRNVAYRGAINLADYTGGQLVYALVGQGRATEAVAVAQDGLARARLARLGPDGEGTWGQRLAAALIAERRYPDALAAARESLAQLSRTGAQVLGLQVALARNAEVVSLINLERWTEADQTYGAFLDSLRGDRVAYDRSYSAPLAALLAAKGGRIDAAVKTIETSLRYRQRIYGLKHYLTIEARAVRGAVYLIGNSPGNAMSDYEDFFTALLDDASGWVDLAPVGPRGQYLNIVLSEYLRYAARQYQSGGQDAIDSRMFDRLVQVTDRLGSGAAQRAILESSARVRTSDPALVALLAQEQDQRARLRDAYAQVTADVVAADVKDTPEDKRRQLRDQLKQHRDTAEATQKQLDDLRAQLATRFPTYLQLVNPVNPTSDAIRKTLVPGEAFVGIYPSRDGTFAWAVNAGGQHALAISPWTDADVATRVAALRATLDVGDKLPRLPAYDFATSLEVYNELLRPLGKASTGATVLDVSAAGPLAALPFAALVTGPATEPKTAPWLVRDVAIAQTPGAAAFVTLRSGDARALATRALIGFGDPQFKLGAASATVAANTMPRARNLVVTAGTAQQAATYTVEQGFRYASIPALPETRDELVALANALGADTQGDLVLGAAATRKAVMTTPLADRRVVAFATHGLMPGDIPGLSKPALAMAAVADPDESPLLNLDDVLGLKLNAQWVVLSACNTAAGERDGAAMSGLVRGFFFAGARSVLATHWAVESESARQLVGAIFADASKDQQASRAANLKRAQLAMVDGTLGAGAYAHPFYWAPYALFGDPIR